MLMLMLITFITPGHKKKPLELKHQPRRNTKQGL